MGSLAPFHPPLGVNQVFCNPHEQTLQMKEKVFSLSGDDFEVTTVSGLHLCRCKGKVLSLSGAKSRAISPCCGKVQVLTAELARIHRYAGQ